MFGRKKLEKEEGKGLSGPKGIPALVQNYLVAERKMDAGLVKLLKAVVDKSTTGEKAYNIRILYAFSPLAPLSTTALRSLTRPASIFFSATR